MNHIRAECENIRRRLSENHLTNIWLIAELEKRGVKVTRTYLSRIISGSSVDGISQKVRTTSILILDAYERTYLQS